MLKSLVDPDPLYIDNVWYINIKKRSLRMNGKEILSTYISFKCYNQAIIMYLIKINDWSRASAELINYIKLNYLFILL